MKSILNYFFFSLLFIVISVLLKNASFIFSGLSIGYVTFFGPSFLPVIFGTKFLLNFLSSSNELLLLNLINTSAIFMEVLIAHFVYQNFKDLLSRTFIFQENLAMVLLVAFVAPFFSGIIATTGHFYLKLIPESAFYTTFIMWYCDNILSIFLVLPFFLSIKNNSLKWHDFLTPCLAFAIISLFKNNTYSPYFFIIFASILIPAFFGSLIGMFFSTIIIYLVMNYFLNNQMGLFLKGTYFDNIIAMQSYLFAIAVSAMTLEGFKKTKLLKFAIPPLFFCWAITGAVYFYYYNEQERADNKAVSNLKMELTNHIFKEMRVYENATKAAKGFVSASTRVEKKEWDEYIKNTIFVNLENGILGVCLIFPEDKNHAAYKYIYPAEIILNNEINFERILSHPGLISFFEKIKNKNATFLTPPLKFSLGKNVEAKDISFLVHPVVKEKQLIAWVVAPFEMEQFFNSIIKSHPVPLDIDIYSDSRRIFPNVKKENEKNLLNEFTPRTNLNLGGVSFLIDWKKTSLEKIPRTSQNSLFVLIGTILSLVVTGFALNLKLITKKARSIVNLKTLNLRKSEEKYKNIFDHSSDALFIFNTYEIIDCNQEALKLFEKHLKIDLFNTGLEALFFMTSPYEKNVNIFKEILKDVKEKILIKFECFFPRATTPFYGEISLRCLKKNDECTFQMSIKDISSKKRMDQILTRSKDIAEETAKNKTHFLARMTHEMRIPLNSILGMINLIIKNHHLPKEVIEDLKTVHYSTQNLLHISNEVLDYNKMESGMLLLEKNPFNLKAMCENVLKAHQPNALEKNIHFIFNYDESIPHQIWGDEFRNIQILNNLLSNAIKFTDIGQITLDVYLKTKKENSCVIEMRVTDTGIGIEKNKQQEIFMDFTQANASHPRLYGGTGLGLAITKHLVEMQGGKINIISELNSGATFVCTLCFDTHENLFHPKKETLKLKNERILLVEDNETNAVVTKKFLEKWGLTVDVAKNGLEGIRHARNIKYALILMDLNMPSMSGIEATKIIRNFNLEIPIILLSGDGANEELRDFKKLGFNEFILKPFQPEKLFVLLEKILKESTQV